MNLGMSKSSKLLKIERLFFNLLALSESSSTLKFYLGVLLRNTIEKLGYSKGGDKKYIGSI